MKLKLTISLDESIHAFKVYKRIVDNKVSGFVLKNIKGDEFSEREMQIWQACAHYKVSNVLLKTRWFRVNK